MKKPEDIGLKIGTKREVLFIDMKKAVDNRIKEHKEGLEVQTEVLKMCETIIAEEQKK